jgi:fructose-1,6-bisphosphatase I
MDALMAEHEGSMKPPTGLEGLDSVTLTRFVLHGQRAHKQAQGDLTILLAAVQLACKVTETCVRRAGIAKLYGLAGSGNVQGEDQKKLDVIANDTFKVNILSSDRCSVMVSEEEDLAIVCDPSGECGDDAKYAIA